MFVRRFAASLEGNSELVAKTRNTIVMVAFLTKRNTIATNMVETQNAYVDITTPST